MTIQHKCDCLIVMLHFSLNLSILLGQVKPHDQINPVEQRRENTLFLWSRKCFYLPLAWYGLRWNIQVSYYEGKTFWSMEEYQVRSKEEIERLVNLINLSYSDETFCGYQSTSA